MMMAMIMTRITRYEAEHSILTAAKLISPVIEETFSLGYNWSMIIMIISIIIIIIIIITTVIMIK